MSKITVLSYSQVDTEMMRRVRSSIRNKGFYVLNDDAVLTYGDIWRPYIQETIENCQALIVVVSSSVQDEVQVQNDLRIARQNGVPILPILVEGSYENIVSNELSDHEWIDFRDSEKYGDSIESLFTWLYGTFGIDPEAEHHLINRALQQITERFTETKWIRIIHTDGITHPTYRFDKSLIQRSTIEDLEEDRFGPIGIVSLSMSERILSELHIGTPKFSAISGNEGTYFLFPIGDGKMWFMAFVITGQVSVDAVVNYFEDQSYLVDLVPLLR